MKKLILLILFTCLSYAILFSQTNWHIGYYSPDTVSSKIDLGLWHSQYKLAYKIDNADLKNLLDSKSDKVLSFIKASQSIDTLQYDDLLEDVLPEGNYFIVHTDYKWLEVSYYNVSKFKFIINSKGKEDFLFTVIDTLNIIRDDAVLTTKKGKKISFDKAFQAYEIPQERKSAKYFLAIEDQLIAFDFLGNKYRYYLGNFKRYQRGFVALDKPMYKKGDTLRYKAFVYDKKEKPYDKEVYLTLSQNYYKDYYSEDLQPVSPGVFMGEIVLNDSLDLDKRYRLKIGYKGDRKWISISNSFDLKDYQLDKYTLTASIDKKIIYGNEEVKVNINAVDFKGELVRNGFYEVEITASDISFVDDNNHFIPNTILKKKKPLLVNSKNTFIIKPADLPKINADFSIKITVWNSANEIHTKELTLVKHMDPQIEYHIKKDSINYIFHNSGDYQMAPDDYKYKITQRSQKSLSFNVEYVHNHPYKILPNKGSIKIDISDKFPGFIYFNEKDTFYQRVRIPNEFNMNSYRAQNKVFVTVDNPQEIYFKYAIFKGKETLLKGNSTVLDTALEVAMDDDIYVWYDYYFQGEHINAKRKLNPNTNNYKVDLLLPDTVAPGKETLVKIRVTDFYGNPVENANITTWANNAEFNNANNTPSFAQSSDFKSYIVGKYSDNITLNPSEYGFSKTMNEAYRKRLMIPESDISYKMMFPDSGIFLKEFPGAEGFCHFAPYVVNMGNFENIYYVLIDEVPIYFANYDARPWAFNYVQGNHNIKIRTYNRLYEVKSVSLKRGKILQIVVDANKSADSLMVTQMPKRLTKSERNMFKYFTKIVSSNGWDNYIQQGNTLFKLGYRRNISPLYSSEFVYVNRGNSKKYSFEQGKNGYRIDNDGINTTEYKVKVRKRLRNYGSYYYFSRNKLGQYPWRFIKDESKKIDGLPIYDFFKKPASDCNLRFILNNSSISIDNIYLIHQESSAISKYNYNFMHLKSGDYRVVAFTNDNNILVYQMNLKPHGKNYISLGDKYIESIPYSNYSSIEREKIVNRLLYDGKLHIVHQEAYDEYSVSDPRIKKNVEFVKIIIEDKNGFTNRYQYYYSEIIHGKDTISSFIRDSVLVPKKNMEYTIIIYNPDYKDKTITLNPAKTEADFIIVKMEREVDELVKYQRTHGWNRLNNNYLIQDGRQGNFLYSSYRGVTSSSLQSVVIQSSPHIGYRIRRSRYQKHKTVLFLGEQNDKGKSMEDALNCPSFGFAPEDKRRIRSDLDGFVGTPASYGDIDNFLMSQDSISMPVPFLLQRTRKDFADVGYWVPNLVTDKDGYAEAKIKFPDNITQWNAVAIAVGEGKKAGMAEAKVVATKNYVARLEGPRFLTEGDSCYINATLINYSKKPLLVDNYFKINDTLKSQSKIMLDSFTLEKHLVIGNSNIQIPEFGFTSKEDVNDAESRIIDVIKQGSSYSKGEFYVLSGDTSITITAKDNDVNLLVYSDLMEVMLSNIQKIITYKYDCNEQKASKLIALVLEKKYKNYLGISFKGNLKIRKLIRELNGSSTLGGWGWWPDSKPSAWITTHVLYALNIAYLNGFHQANIRYPMMSFLRDFEGKDGGAAVRYMQIRNGFIRNPLLEKWNQYNNTIEDKLWNLKSKEALNMDIKVSDVLKLSHSTLKGGLYWGENDYAREENKILCTSLAFELIYKLDSINPALDKILLYMLTHHGYDKLNTYEMAYMVNAVMPYLMDRKSKVPVSNISDGEGKALAFNKLITIRAGETFTLKKTGSSKVFAISYSNFFDSSPQPVDSLFKVTTFYRVKDSLVQNVNAGDKVVLNVVIDAKHKADYTMIEIPLPASCTYSESSIAKNVNEVHREKYKDKLIIYCETMPEGKTTFKVELEARFEGKFHVNPVVVKEMYYPIFFGRNGVNTIKVHGQKH